jgi:16S rRNA (adenine1518-N6/adenine1519-N6)-dimethyltransferase
MARAAELDGADEVLEVGPGLGVLTAELVRRARRVVAVELDRQLAAALPALLGGPANLEVVQADALAVEPAALFAGNYKLVANLPYHITSPALRHLLGTGPPFPARLVVMLQSEVADRLTAKPGQLSALGVTIQAQAAVRLVRRVPAAAFYPRPNVESTVLLLEPLPDAERPVGRDKLGEFVRLVQAGFKQPRKQLGNSLAEGLQLDKASALDLLGRAGIDPSRRPQELTIREWVALFRAATSA